MLHSTPYISSEWVSTYGSFQRDVSEKKNVLIIMDEIQIAAAIDKTICNTFEQLFTIDYIYSHDVKFIEFSATPDGLKYTMSGWMDDNISRTITPEPDEGYTGSRELIAQGRMRQFKDLCGWNARTSTHSGVAIRNVYELRALCHERWPTSPKYHLIRGNTKSYDHHKELLERHFNVITYDCQSGVDLESKLGSPPEEHTVILLKDMLRCSNTVCKQNIGIFYERFVTKINDSVMVQGLAGRNTGYDVTGDSLVFTNVDSFTRYHQCRDSGWTDATIPWNSNTTVFNTRLGRTVSRSINFNSESLYDTNVEPVSTVRAPDTDRDHRVFDTMLEAWRFGNNLGFRKRLRKNNQLLAPAELRTVSDTTNPTLEYILDRWWGLSNTCTTRMVRTDQDKWCVYWRPSMLATELE